MTDDLYRIIVVDDEPLARSGIRRLIEADSACRVVGEAGDGTHALELVRRLRPNILFLDVQMPGLGGFDVLRAIEPGMCPAIVLVTAFDRYAVAAFDSAAIDYLLKPFSDERFARALARAKVAAGVPVSSRAGMQREMLDGSRRAGMAERLLVRVNGRALVVDLDTLDRVEAVGAYVRLHMGKQVIETRRTLRAMRSLLDPSKFCQVHRSTIVRLDRIRELQPYFHGDAIAILSDGTRLRVSRERRARLEAALGGGDSGQGE